MRLHAVCLWEHVAYGEMNSLGLALSPCFGKAKVGGGSGHHQSVHVCIPAVLCIGEQTSFNTLECRKCRSYE